MTQQPPLLAHPANAGDPTQKMDARIVKTLRSIEAAFFALLEQKNYDDITVQDILDHAVINRTTFYKYYTNKNDLAEHMVNAIKDKFLIPLLELSLSTPWEEVASYAEDIINNNRDTLRLLWQIETPKINLKQDSYDTIKRRYIEVVKADNPALTDLELEFQAHIYASFGLSMLCYGMNCKEDWLSPDVKHANLKSVFERILH